MNLVEILIKILVLGLVFGLVYAILVNTVIPALPAGFGKFVLAIAGLIAILLVLAIIFPGAIGGLTVGLPLLFFGGVRAVPRAVDPTPRAMLVAVTGTGDGNVPTSPPKTPNQLGLARLWNNILPVLPLLWTYVADPLVESWATVQLPEEYKPFAPILTGLILAYQAWRKREKEQDRMEAAKILTALDVPIGQPLSAADARKVAQ